MQAVDEEMHPLTEGLSADDIEEQACDSSPELVELSVHQYLSSTLQNAQKQTPTAKGLTKHPHTSQNQGKSDRTVRRNKKARRDLEAQGFLPLLEFFQWKATAAQQQESQVTLRMGSVPGVKKGAALVILLEEKEEEEDRMRTNTLLIHASEEERGETETEAETGKTNNEPDKMITDNCRAKVIPMCQIDPRNAELIGRCCGPSWIVLLKIEESECKSSDSKSTQSNLEDIHSTETRELEGHCHGDAPNDAATQLPTGSAVDLLRDHAELQRVHRELAAKAKLGDLDSMLQDHVVAMLRLLNLFFDTSLGYTWKKALEVITKMEGHGMNHAWSIQQWVVKFAHTHELQSHRHGQTW